MSSTRVLARSTGRVARPIGPIPMAPRASTLVLYRRPLAGPRSPPALSALTRYYASKSFPPHTVVTMPALSPTMTAGNIGTWQKKAGDSLAPGDVLVEIETDKAQMDFEFQEEGVLAKILKDAGEKDVAVGNPIAVMVEEGEDIAPFDAFTLEDAGGEKAPAPAPKEEASQSSEPASSGSGTAPPPSSTSSSGTAQESTSTGARLQTSLEREPAASPQAKALALERGVPIKAVKGTGPNGRITREDIEKYQTSSGSGAASGVPGPAYEDTPATSMRKTIANRLVQSVTQNPHYFVSSTVSVSRLLKLRQALNTSADGRYKLSLNDFLVKACAVACLKVPAVNSSWRGEEGTIRQHHTVDVSVAVATPVGLMTPIVKNVQGLGLESISAQVKDLGKRARDGKLKPEEYQGGTFTISNMGMNAAVERFTAVINPPQAGILAVGTTKKVAVPVETEDGTSLEWDDQIDVTGSFDHKVVDGAVGGEWIREFKKVVENPVELMLPSLVDNPQIRSATLHNPLPLYLHTYVWPFLFLWPAFLAVYLSPERYDQHIQSSEWTFVWTGAIVTLQSLAWLSTHWHVGLKSLFTLVRARDVASAKLIRIVPVANAGAAEICPLIREQVGGKQNTSFLFQKRRFLYVPEHNTFAPLAYPLDATPKPSLATFQTSRGLETAKEVQRQQQHFGDNTFDIPVPTFTELFKEHAVAPFFVFQIFCVGLWLLDEYWYYSLFTLFMLVAFESTVVWQRQRTLNEFRGMSIKPYAIWVHRSGRWQEIQSDKLLPGDLVSLGRTKEDSGVACDMLLVEGTAIVNEAMLSGESTPLLKDSVQLRPASAVIEPEGLDKNAFVYGGTKVLQVTHAPTGEDGQDDAPVHPSGVTAPPDNGALAIVTRTGFETSQGSLVRTMIYSTERVSANNFEALLFILFLLIFAIAASWYVWQEGVAKDRKRSKLLLDCVLIITSVVPPELPMELSLAVNTSLAALSRYAIYCTEPFRIPFAGRVDIACFDKTGTLTGEDLVVEGIAGLDLAAAGKDGAHNHLTLVRDADQATVLVLATAHALVKLDEGEVVGDPMEKATLTSLGWTLGRNDTLTSKNHAHTVQIKRRFQFSSALKRQSAVASITATNPQTSKRTKTTFAGVKGAPETIRAMLVSTPPGYEETYKDFTRKGSRVLALGYKYLATEAELGQNRINNLKREEVESQLTFAGFLVLQCPLKDDAKKAVRMLNESSHRVVMITGDNPLTAVHVARKVEIVDRDVLILDAPEHDTSGTKLVWRSIDDLVQIPVDPQVPLDAEIIAKNDLCVTGYALAKFQSQPGLAQILRHAWVYARVSPKQKEDLLTGLKDAGYTTLMCGDGTNDVGALKQAHIGVALLNGTQEDLTKISNHFRMTKMKEMYEQQISLMKRFNQPPPPVPAQIAHLYPPGPKNPHHEAAMQREAERKGAAATAVTTTDQANGIETITTPGAKALQQAQNSTTPQQQRQEKAQQAAAGIADKFTASMLESELDDSEPPTIKLGDASVAAPFTSKLANVVAIPNIIRQGRCTLVATIQMYKILALNCLISAYSLSVLYLEGIKFGDGQVTISGMLMSVCFLSISRAKPVEQLSKERPQSNIFNPYIIGSVLGQFAVHIVTLIYVSRYVQQIEPRSDDVDLEGEFEPSLLNSAVYLLQLIQQISTFAINYQGRPFRESIRENRGMFWGLILVSGVAFSCSTEFIPELNEKLRLVPFTAAFKVTMTTVMILDYAACWIIETGLKYAFSDYRPKEIALRRPDQLERERERTAREKAIEDKEKEEKADKLRIEKEERARKATEAMMARWGLKNE
ncbi:MAG: hypothetical protein M1838_000176 [Thelocarpon superellum]|nr:MAG: hypothetical protein M1838_000176 [Thelocarpon superellum]